MTGHATPDRVCATCQFWSRDATLEEIPGKPINVQGLCGGITTSWAWRVEEGDPGDGKAMLIDANAELITSPDFGCKLWEAARS